MGKNILPIKLAVKYMYMNNSISLIVIITVQKLKIFVIPIKNHTVAISSIISNVQ